MLLQLLVGGAASLANIAIHSVWTVYLDHTVERYWLRRNHVRFLSNRVVLMMVTVAILMTGHVAEVLVWAATYEVVNATPAGANHVYLAFVNYTTLGYGDVLPVARWQLLGPLTALNGILLIGWSTAIIFEIVRTSHSEVRQR
jgi:carbon starvation protein CstA